jgi:general secretion pathway protein C
MGFDAIFKRYFPAVLCLLIGVAAYFQASGMGQMVAASIALDPSATPVARTSPRPPPPAAAVNQDHTTNAGAIISRNPFDSVTGPLDGKPIEPLPSASAAPDANRDPYQDPACDAAKVLLIVASDEPEWSFASIAGPDGKSMLRRQGDEINGHTVFFIGDLRPEERRSTERRDVWDRVWLTGNSGRCQMGVGGKAPTKSAATTPPPASAASNPSGDAGGTRRKSKVTQEIADKIHKISETEFSVERSVVDTILENQAELMRSARIVPEKEGDKIVGIRLFGIRSDSLLGTLGLENGDRLSSINGFEMTDPQKALEAYSKLRTADHLTVAVNRRGKPMNIDFNIK